MNFGKIFIFINIFCTAVPAVSQDKEEIIYKDIKLRCSGVVRQLSEIVISNKKKPVYERISEQYISLDFTFSKDAVNFESLGSNNLLVTQCFLKSPSSEEKAGCQYLWKSYNYELEEFKAKKTLVLGKLRVKSMIDYTNVIKALKVEQFESQNLKYEKKYNELKIGILNCSSE